MRKLVLAALCATVWAVDAPAPAHAAPEPKALLTSATVLLNGDDLAAIQRRKADFTTLLDKCNKESDYRALPVAVFAPDPHYSATGVNTSPNNGKRLAVDALVAYRAGLCYTITRDTRYAATAQRILDAWANTLKSVTTGQGKSAVNFDLPYMIAAASWIRDANGWNRAPFDDFLRTTILPNSASDNPNNHGMWGVFLEASAAAYLGDALLLTKARDRWGDIFRGAADPDGTLIREIERSGTTNWRGGADKGIRGLAYTHYFLLPASMAAKVFADQGQPVWTTDGGNLLQAAFGRAATWTLHPETFPFYASNGGKLQDTRGVAYFNLLLRYYPSADAKAVLAQGDVGDGGFLLPKLFPYVPRQ